MTAGPRGAAVEAWERVIDDASRTIPAEDVQRIARAVHAEVAQLLAEAVAAEREACARIADEFSASSAIRARGERRAETAP